MTSLKVSTFGYGVQLEEIVGIFQAKGAAFTKGDVVMVAMDDGATYLSNEVTQNNGVAATTSPFTVVKTPTAGQVTSVSATVPSYCWFGVCQENIAQDAYGRVLVRGRTQALCTGAVVRGVGLPVNTSKQLVAGTVVGQRIVAWAIASQTGGLVDCYFEGINGTTSYAN